MGIYSSRERWLPCDGCGAPLSAPIEGGRVPCPQCGGTLNAPPRPDTRVPPSPSADELGRRTRLRAQDGQPLVPPPGYEQLVSGSTVPAHKLAEARMLWTATRTQLVATPADFAAAERLVWLTLMLRNTLTEQRAIRALVEGALEVLMLPRHRQLMLGFLSRDAVKEGDLSSGRDWLGRCDPASEDLSADSTYRISYGLLETAQGDYTKVLEILGASEEEVPIHDSMDPIAVVLRANAWERLGRVDSAKAELTKFMGRGGQASAVEAVIGSMPPTFHLCAQSIGVARAEVRQAVGKRAASQAGGAMGWLVALLGGGLPLVVLVSMLASEEFEWPALFMLLFPLIFGSMGMRMIRSAKRTKEIAREGLHGRGRIVAVRPTGTRINDVPLMKIDVQVTVNGHPPVMASTKRLIGDGGGHLVGGEVPVIWHPKYPAEVVLDA